MDRKSKKKIYFIFDKYKKKKEKKIQFVLKISAIPSVLRNREITGTFNTFDDIYLVFKKVNILYLFHNLQTCLWLFHRKVFVLS